MDLLEQGKKLAQDGHFEEALEAFILALENDKENADIHFYLGLCYSSLEQFGYARYHYDMALTLKPNHAKTQMVYAGLKEFYPEKPPERRLTRKAAAKARRSQSSADSEPADQTYLQNQPSELANNKSSEPKIKITDDKWERAFPAESILQPEEKVGGFKLLILALLGIAIVALIVYFSLSFFME